MTADDHPPGDLSYPTPTGWQTGDLEAHLNARHDHRLNDLMGTSHDDQLALHHTDHTFPELQTDAAHLVAAAADMTTDDVLHVLARAVTASYTAQPDYDDIRTLNLWRHTHHQDPPPTPDRPAYNWRGEEDHHAEYTTEAIRTANGDPQRSTIYALLAIADALNRLAAR